MFMQKIEMAAVTCDLFGVTKGFDGNGGHAVDSGKGARVANEAEALAYADFIRRKCGAPEIGKAKLHTAATPGERSRRSLAFHYVGATYGAETDKAGYNSDTRERTPAQYESGAFSVLFPGANQMRATVTMETLDDAGEVITSQTMPVEPKKGGVVWSKDDVRKACGPVAKVKAARKAPTVAKRRAAPTCDKRRRAIMLALKLRAELRRERAISASRFGHIMDLTRDLHGVGGAESRENCAATAPALGAPAMAPDAILSDLAAAQAMIRGETYVAPRRLAIREAFAALYRIARRDKLAGVDLLHAACDLTGEPHETFKCPRACRLHTAVTRALEAPEPMREKLARQVLNCWGHGNPFRSPAMESPRFPAWRAKVNRADALRKRLADAGRLEYDAGGWVVRVLLLPVTPEAAPTAIQRRERTPAHERAIRRAWAERAAFRKQRAMAAEVKAELKAAWQVQAELQDRARLAEQEAAEALAAREDLKRMLADAQARLSAAEAENAQLWAEIEALTAPTPALAA